MTFTIRTVQNPNYQDWCGLDCTQYCVSISKGRVHFTSTAFDVFNETEIPSKATSSGQDADFALLWLHWILNGDSLYYVLKEVLNEDKCYSGI